LWPETARTASQRAKRAAAHLKLKVNRQNKRKAAKAGPIPLANIAIPADSDFIGKGRQDAGRAVPKTQPTSDAAGDPGPDLASATPEEHRVERPTSQTTTEAQTSPIEAEGRKQKFQTLPTAKSPLERPLKHYIPDCRLAVELNSAGHTNGLPHNADIQPARIGVTQEEGQSEGFP
jgi:hypothetical protein